MHFPEAGAPPERLEAFGKSLVKLVDRQNPADSLLLNKPTNRIKHSGLRPREVPAIGSEEPERRARLSDSALAVLRLLTSLRYLDLGRPHPGQKACARRAERLCRRQCRATISGLKELHVLRLDHSRINTDGLHILSSLDKVEKLALEGRGLVDDQSLAELAHWKSLKYLDIQDTKATPQGVAEFEKARPQCCSSLEPAKLVVASGTKG